MIARETPRVGDDNARRTRLVLLVGRRESRLATAKTAPSRMTRIEVAADARRGDRDRTAYRQRHSLDLEVGFERTLSEIVWGRAGLVVGTESIVSVVS